MFRRTNSLTEPILHFQTSRVSPIEKMELETELETDAKSESIQRQVITIQDLDCGVCYQRYSINNFTPWTCCEHWKQCCTGCLDEWASRCIGNDRIVTCPMCRGFI